MRSYAAAALGPQAVRQCRRTSVPAARVVDLTWKRSSIESITIG
jgi:hypothetical protein